MRAKSRSLCEWSFLLFLRGKEKASPDDSECVLE